MTADEFSQLVRNPRRRADGVWWDSCCPGHEDQRPSLSFSDGDRGLVLDCKAGCTFAAIAHAVGRQPSEFFHTNGQEPRAPRTVAATYDYFDETRTLLYQVVRYEPKDFCPRRPDGKGGWIWNLKATRRVVYRLPDLTEAIRVFFVEGERDADRLWSLGLPTTTTQGGAQSWTAGAGDYARQLVEVAIREVVVIPDHDRPGHAYASGVARALQAAGLTVRRLVLPDLGPILDKHGRDVSDWLDAGHFATELVALAETAPLFTGAADAAPTPAAPTITHEGDDYGVTWLDGITLSATALRESSGEVHAELTILQGEAVLSWGRLNLASTSAREQLVKKLEAAAPRIAPWRERLEVACRQIAALAREGAPLAPLEPAPRPAVSDLIERVLPLGETSIIYADGDSGKGWLALAMAVAYLTGQALPHLRPLRRDGRVAYLDWETTVSEVAARVHALCLGLGVTLPPGALLYRPMTRALADDAARLRVDFDRQGVGFVIVDSFVPACGADPEGADATIRLMNSLRTFARATRLVLAHVNRLDADKAHGTTRPWGSVFVRNLARATWELKRPTPDGDDLVLGCYLTKRNDAPRGAPPWGLRFQFRADGAVVVADEPLTRAPGLLAKATTWQQIHAALSHGPQTAEAVALTLDLNVKTVRRTLERHRDLGHVVTPRGHDPLVWSLVSSREPA